MSAGRYTFVKRLNNFTSYATTDISARIYFAIERGSIPYNTHILKDGERLDTIAGTTYGSGTLWRIIAAASGIGWGAQVPNGTLLKIPTDLSIILTLGRK